MNTNNEITPVDDTVGNDLRIRIEGEMGQMENDSATIIQSHYHKIWVALAEGKLELSKRLCEGNVLLESIVATAYMYIVRWRHNQDDIIGESE